MLRYPENPDIIEAAKSGVLEVLLRQQYYGRARRKKLAARRANPPAFPEPVPLPAPEMTPGQRLNFLLCLAVVGGWNGSYSKTEIIKREICCKYGVTMREIRPTGLRGHSIVQARHEAFWRMGRETKLTLVDIGRLFGGFDHTSVLHGQRHYEKVRSRLIVGRPLAKSFDWDLSKMILGAGNIEIEIATKNEGN